MNLNQALQEGCSYAALGVSLRQWLSEDDFVKRTLTFHIDRSHCYSKLPNSVRQSVDETNYYTKLLHAKKDQLQLYPYTLWRQVVQFTSITPLSYYTTMLAELLCSGRPYDELPNFTATDIVALLRIGRNEYLQLRKDTRRGGSSADYDDVRAQLPSELRGVTALPPFDIVIPVPLPVAVEAGLARCDATGVRLYDFLLRVQQRQMHDCTVEDVDKDLMLAAQSLGISLGLVSQQGSCRVGDLPQAPLLYLYRRGLVLTHAVVKEDDRVTTPPLDHFVMNRAASTPQELLFYRVMSTIDIRVPLRVQAQLLMLPDEELCATVGVLMHLGLVAHAAPAVAHRSRATLPVEIGAAPCDDGCVSQDRSHNAGATMVETSTGDPSPHVTAVIPTKRIALLYDATLSGCLMMTNLSKNPAFKRYAVTLFEVGKLPDEMLDGFLALLDRVDDDDDDDGRPRRCSESLMAAKGSEVQRYVNCVGCLRKLLSILRDVDGPLGTRGVDMLKTEAVNEWEATTRYALLGRLYWAYIVATPTACVPRVGPEMQPMFGSTVTLMSSPWLLLYLYTQMRQGPPTLLLPRGCQLNSWPSLFAEVRQQSDVQLHSSALGNCRPHRHSAPPTPMLRLQTLALDAEVCELDARSSLIQVCEKVATTPLCIQYCLNDQGLQELATAGSPALGEKKDRKVFITTEVRVPFVADTAQSEMLIVTSLCQRMGHNVVIQIAKDSGGSDACNLCPRATETLQLQDTAGYFTLRVSAVLVCTDLPKILTTVTAGAHQTTCPHPVTDHGSAFDRDETEDTAAAMQCKWREEGGGGSRITPLALKDSTSAPHALYEARTVTSHIVGISLGVPLNCDTSFTIIAESLPRLLHDHARERHGEVMRKLTDNVGLFIEKHSLASRVHQSELAVQSSALVGPMTIMHFRREGDDGAVGPRPSFPLLFDGHALSTVDELDTCV